MTLDDHGTHEVPYVFVGEEEPRYVGICLGHIGPRWSEPEPYEPIVVSEDELLARRAVRAQEPHVEITDEMIVDDAFSRPVESATDYEFLLREQIVMQTIIGLQRDFRDLSFTVSFYAGSTEQRDHALGKRFPKGDARLSEWKGAPIVRTADVEDVRFLIGHRISMAVHPNVSILCRARDFAGVFSTDYDIDRFYVTDGDGTLLRYSLAAIRELDLRLVSDPMTDVWICAGTPEYLAAVRGAIVNGRDDLEILFPA